MPHPQIVAHRGSASDRPENALSSFSTAAESGADQIELDVHMSSDGQLVVMHDAMLEQTGLGDEPIRVDTRAGINLGLTCISATTDVPAAEVAAIIERLHEAGGAFIRLGSAALTLAQVAAGRLVGYYEPRLHAWDCVAGLLIVEEAGGVTLPFPISHDGVEIGSAFAAAPQVRAQFLAIVKGHG